MRAAIATVFSHEVFKTLVVRGDRQGVCLAVIPGNTHLDLKALARLTVDRKMDTVLLNQAQPLTGYIRGGVTALACKKDVKDYSAGYCRQDKF